MIAHLFKLVWNRRRSNLLVVVEMFFCFLVLFAVLTTGAYFAEHYMHPLGFSYNNVWEVEIESDGSTTTAAQVQERIDRLTRVTASMDEVESVGAVVIVPFSNSMQTTNFMMKGQLIGTLVNTGNEMLDDVLGIEVTRGRWFEKGDEKHHWMPVIINEHMASEVFGKENPVGKVFPAMEEGQREKRVVGVIKDFRQGNELSVPGNYYFEYTRSFIDDTLPPSGQSLMFKVRSGVPAEFEERLLERLHAEDPSVKYRVRQLEDMHSSTMRLTLMPLLIAAIVAGFLLLMAALGLVGVLWQNVARRTREIGLRRALGAGSRDIYRQILGELLVLMSFALAAGSLFVVQVPLLGLIDDVSTAVYAVGLVASLGVMYVLAIACGLYPGILAMRVQPTEALHYE